MGAQFYASPYRATFTHNGGTKNVPFSWGTTGSDPTEDGDIGCTEKGFTLTITPFFKDIKTDCTADMIADQIFRGIDGKVECNLVECGNSNVQKLITWYTRTNGKISVGAGLNTNIGGLQIADQMDGTLTLTPRFAASGRGVFTFPHASIKTENLSLSSDLATVKATFQLLPDPETGDIGTIANSSGS
jgi:hypothetical protein